MKNNYHYHLLEPIEDDPYHHFYCKRLGCEVEFWSDLAMDTKNEEMYYLGHDEGLRDAYRLSKIIERIRLKLRLRKLRKKSLRKNAKVKA
jgi:hypothetical protein